MNELLTPPGFHLGYVAGRESVLPEDDERLAKLLCASYGATWYEPNPAYSAVPNRRNRYWLTAAVNLRKVLVYGDTMGLDIRPHGYTQDVRRRIRHPVD